MLAGKLSWAPVALAPAVVLACLIVSLRLPANAEGAKPPSARAGHELSIKFCRSCHLIDRSTNDTALVGPPSFASIANQPGQTAQRITNVLIQSHPPMPDMQLTIQEIQNIIAYLDTMRTDAPPLLPAPGQSEPKFPRPT